MLDLPEPDRSQLSHSPLDLVVCQIRFDARSAISASKFGFSLQGALGGASGGSWSLDPVDLPAPMSITLTPEGPQQGPVGLPTRGWRLTHEQGAYNVLLVPDSLAIDTRRYSSWDEFRAMCVAAIGSVADLARPEIELRVGLRYVDRLADPAVKTPAGWAGKLRTPLRGLVGHDSLGETVLNQQQQIVLKLEAGAECRFSHGTLETPTGLEYVLDYDLYRQLARPFDPDDVIECLDAFNTEALKLFQASLEPATLEGLR